MASFGFVFLGWLGILLFFYLELGWSTLGQHPRKLRGLCSDLQSLQILRCFLPAQLSDRVAAVVLPLWRRCPGRLGTASRALHDLNRLKTRDREVCTSYDSYVMLIKHQWLGGKLDSIPSPRSTQVRTYPAALDLFFDEVGLVFEICFHTWPMSCLIAAEGAEE